MIRITKFIVVIYKEVDESDGFIITSFVTNKKPNHADNSEMTDDDIIIRYEKDEIIGLSVLNANKRINPKNS